MRFAEPFALLLASLAPLVVLLHLLRERRLVGQMQRAGDERLLTALIPPGVKARRRVQTILLASGVLLGVLALARPQFGMRTEIRRGRGMDVVIALDLSRSMLARDLVPSRLERARIEIKELVDHLVGDRVGFVGFTSIALPLCPLTVDHSALMLQVRSATPDDLPRGGTSIADAIRAGKQMLESSRATGAGRAILILTDGEENEGGDPATAAKDAHESGIEVHTIGVGSRTGEPIPLIGESGAPSGYLKDRSGETVVSRLDEGILRRVAEAGGGTVALPGSTGGLDLRTVRDHLARLKKAELEDRTTRIYEERYQWALAPAFVLILLASCLRPSRKSSQRATRATSRSLVVGLSLCLLSETVYAGPFEREEPDTKAGTEHLRAGRSKEAVEAYSRAHERLGNHPRLLFNRGIAQAAQGELEPAIADLTAAMEGLPSGSDRAQAAFALGNTLRKLKRWDEAAASYRRALMEDPEHSAAQRNLEISRHMKKLAEELQKKQEKDPNKNQEQDKDKDKDKSKDQKKDKEQEKDQDQKNDQGQSQDDQQQPSGGDAGVDPNGGDAKETPTSSDQREAEELLDTLKEQEKVLKRKRILEQVRGKEVEKDW